ncbi:hypothetical protein [Butyricimonas synergistica]|uniref:hypothetical protein n=1 Tax=Butyricimonas synergistica TaxID=544644 RepID=UPI0012DC24B1|nr:hypothetical protein [Butyricimonas synergistica]
MKTRCLQSLMMIIFSLIISSCGNSKLLQVEDSLEKQSMEKDNKVISNTWLVEKVSSISYYENNSTTPYYIIGLGISAKAYFVYPHDKDFEKIMDVLKYSAKKQKSISIIVQLDSNNRYKIISAKK